MPVPRVIYQPRPGSPIDVDRAFYGRLGRETETCSLIERFVVPIRSGRAWPVLAGQICRIVVVEGAQVAGLTKDDRYFVKPSPVKQGDYFEFFAEIDLLCAISTCPQGDLSVQAWGEDADDPIGTCHPLGVEIYQPRPGLLEGWQSPPTSDYRGIHGLDRI